MWCVGRNIEAQGCQQQRQRPRSRCVSVNGETTQPIESTPTCSISSASVRKRLMMAMMAMMAYGNGKCECQSLFLYRNPQLTLLTMQQGRALLRPLRFPRVGPTCRQYTGVLTTSDDVVSVSRLSWASCVCRGEISISILLWCGERESVWRPKLGVQNSTVEVTRLDLHLR